MMIVSFEQHHAPSVASRDKAYLCVLCTTRTACRNCVSDLSLSRCVCMHCLRLSDFPNHLHSMQNLCVRSIRLQVFVHALSHTQ